MFIVGALTIQLVYIAESNMYVCTSLLKNAYRAWATLGPPTLFQDLGWQRGPKAMQQHSKGERVDSSQVRDPKELTSYIDNPNYATQRQTHFEIQLFNDYMHGDQLAPQSTNSFCTLHCLPNANWNAQCDKNVILAPQFGRACSCRFPK